MQMSEAEATVEVSGDSTVTAAKSRTKAKVQKERDDSDEVIFESANEEVYAFDILVAGELIRGSIGQGSKRLRFAVPSDKVERFRLHHHVVTGRIVEK
jgi:hypothetical protein